MLVEPAPDAATSVELLWIPLGSGAIVVRACGRLYERLVSIPTRRRPQPLFHSALRIRTAGRTTVIEVTPVPDADGSARGVVAGGAVGLRAAGALRVFRYEVRCWTGGVIPDASDAVGPPVIVSASPEVAGAIVELAPRVPTPTWGRDDLGAGEMWNSNSVVSWLLESAGVSAEALAPPLNGRAPGWRAGVVVARRAKHIS